jgi:Poxvirus proteins of unknown function.
MSDGNCQIPSNNYIEMNVGAVCRYMGESDDKRISNAWSAISCGDYGIKNSGFCCANFTCQNDECLTQSTICPTTDIREWNEDSYPYTPTCPFLDGALVQIDVGDCGTEGFNCDGIVKDSQITLAPGMTCLTTCTYDISKITTGKQLQEFIDAFQNEDPDFETKYNLTVAPMICSGTSSTCSQYQIPNETSLGTTSVCSNITATGDGILQGYCQAWASNSKYQNCIDSVMTEICNAHPSGNFECACLDAELNVLYRSLGGVQDANKVCWWSPCQNSTMYLVTPQLITQEGSCNPEICEQVLQNIDDGNVDENFPDAHFFINCNRSTSDGTVGKIVDFFSSWEGILVIVVIIILVIGIIVISVIFIDREKKKEKGIGKKLINKEQKKEIKSSTHNVPSRNVSSRSVSKSSASSQSASSQSAISRSVRRTPVRGT